MYVKEINNHIILYPLRSISCHREEELSYMLQYTDRYAVFGNAWRIIAGCTSGLLTAAAVSTIMVHTDDIPVGRYS